MVLEWKSSPPPPSPAWRRLSAPTSLDRNLPIFFFLPPPLFFFAFPVLTGCDCSLAASLSFLPPCAFFLSAEVVVGISGCEKAATSTKDPPAPAATWTELTSAASAAWWGGGEAPPEEYGDVVAEEEEARVVVVAEEEAERCARRSRRQLGHTPLDTRCSGCRLHRSSHSDRRIVAVAETYTVTPGGFTLFVDGGGAGRGGGRCCAWILEEEEVRSRESVAEGEGKAFAARSGKVCTRTETGRKAKRLALRTGTTTQQLKFHIAGLI
ncbi:hypothetical protein U9M48_006403 [Paspalum notatum var. saurae]|uniref:Uncharacterized protein n=1 Tax=Paspalum notatum var. saurae TaxID=547442 RepID=A0AAQ3SLR9_PASNO